MKINDRNMAKSCLSEAYTRVGDGETRREALAEYETLCRQSDLSNRILARHLLRSILPAVAFYRALLRNGYTSVYVKSEFGASGWEMET
ncbi:MAG: hypothetical protein LBR26_03405 [Prevotella sp.]|jgi:hypothetical protein|nr:hypothetical protein [Prevotella sp.]